MKNIMSVFALGLTAVVACGGLGAAQTPPQTQTPAQTKEARDLFVRAYRIGPEDILEINVFEVEEMNRTVRVEEDGTITLPLIGRVAVGGLTQEGVAQKLTELLQAGFIKNPQVTIFIKEYKSRQVGVLGAVETPGSYQLVGRKTLLQMLSMAGGLSETAGNDVLILREGPDGETSTIRIDLRELWVNGNKELNIPIEPNDVINVPVDREIRVFVTGRVRNPGPITAKLSEGITLLQAIAGAGGLAEGAKQTAITIKRKGPGGQEVMFKVNYRDVVKGKKMDMPLQEGDVVVVPESFW